MPPCILTRNLQLVTREKQSSQHYYEKGINIKNTTRGNKIQVEQDVGTGTNWIWTGYRYRNSNTTNKPRINLKDNVFTQGRAFESTKYEDSIKNVINYTQQE